MENKSKNNTSIFMILGGLIILANYIVKYYSPKHNANIIIIIVCATLFIILGILSLRNGTANKNS